jgi:hypothetical protein
MLNFEGWHLKALYVEDQCECVLELVVLVILGQLQKVALEVGGNKNVGE